MSFLTTIATVLLLGVTSFSGGASVLGDTSGRPSDFVVMQFTAKWCEPCKEMQPAIEQLSQQGWMIRNVDVDLEKSIVQRMKVTQLPTLLILKNGLEVNRITGVHSSSELAKLLPAVTPSTLVTEPMALATGNVPQPPSSTLAPFPMLDANPNSPQPSRTSMVSGRKPTPEASDYRSGGGDVGSLPPQVDPMSTTVRIKTEDQSSMAFGSGTMIDQVNGEVLVITCGHLFRDLKPTTRIIVEAPINGQLGQFAGTVIDYKCDETDIGLLSFKTGVQVPVAKLLPRGTALREGESVASFGCDGGADPTRRNSQITKLNRYMGPSNVEVAKAPVQGRSGGGLFNQSGQLIGVCYAADKELDEGLYSGPEVVYEQLSRLGLTRLYTQPTATATDSTLADVATSSSLRAKSNPQFSTSVGENVFPDQIQRDPRSRSGTNLASQDWQQTVDQAAQLARSNASAIATASASLGSTSSITASSITASSITATIRDASGRERTVSIPNPSPALLQMLEGPTQTAQLSNSPSSFGAATITR